ncbi:MAG: TldD/PmbA family protein [Niameybacter sp.]|uniref:TldD/PmbA family protein n=1 Tax=Niameybacter sp. TaxID=2033640 RepID=UPI002FCA13EB
MQIEMSTYLKQAKPYLKSLLNQLLEVYTYVSILGTDASGKSYRISRAGTNIGNGMFDERGFVVKVYNGKTYSEYAFNEIDATKVDEIVAQITQLVKLPECVADTVGYSAYAQLKEESCTFSKSKEVRQHPKALGDEKIVQILTALHEKGKSQDTRIVDFRGDFEYLETSKCFLSKHKDLEQSFMWSTGALMCVVAEGDKNNYHYKGFSGACGSELIEEMGEFVEEVAQVACELLQSEKMIPGTYDVICAPDVAGLIAHEAFGHGVEMDMFVKDRALAKDYIGEYVASPLVTMHDGAVGEEDAGSYFFDDEGTLAQDVVIIEKGILKQGISDQLTAMKLGTRPTGNGRRESFERKAYSRMTNTYFKPGTSTLGDMIASIEEGYLIDASASGMEDPKNWGIQCMVSIAREIRNGRLTGKIYSPVVLTGYVPDLLKSISMVSSDLVLTGTGACGKGYKEWVKVSTGGPYIKARVRLG